MEKNINNILIIIHLGYNLQLGQSFYNNNHHIELAHLYCCCTMYFCSAILGITTLLRLSDFKCARDARDEMNKIWSRFICGEAEEDKML